MKITILALHLGYGGIEKFVCNIANMFIKENNVEIVSIYKLYDKPPFYVDEKIKITYLLEDLKPNRTEFYNSIKSFNIIEFLKQTYKSLKILYLKRYRMKKAVKDIGDGAVISTIYAHNKLISKYCKKSIKKVATEHNYNDNNKTYIKKVINSCKNIDYLIIASKQLSEIYYNKMKNCKVINIPLSLDYIPDKVSKLNKKNITYIGRLSKEKCVIDLIDIFKEIYKKDSEAILNIIGDGEEKSNIIVRIEENNLSENIILHGYKSKSEIEKILLETSIGINTSYTESFGLAILETFSYGIPCVAFDSAEGMREIISNGKDGYIIPNRDFSMMADRILELINDSDKLKEFGGFAREKSLQYETDKIKLKWYNILK